MSGRGWLKRHLDRVADAQVDANAEEMTARVEKALADSILASRTSQEHIQEAQRLLGAVRREIAVAQVAKKGKPA